MFNEKRLHRHRDEMKPSSMEQQIVKSEPAIAPATKETAVPTGMSWSYTCAMGVRG